MKTPCVTIVDNFADWQGLASEWNRVLDESSSGSFFLTWEWLYSWAECCLGENRRLFILLFHEEGRLVGIAPFYVERRKIGPFPLREIRFLGSPEAGSDYLDVFSRRGREREVANSLYDFLLGEGSGFWDQIALSDIPAGSLFLLHFMSKVETDGKYAETTRSSYCPFVKLPASEADLYAMLSPGWRKKFKQVVRVVNREKDVFHAVFQGSQASARLGKFFEFYGEKSGYSSGVLPKVFDKLNINYNGEPPIQIDFLSVDGKIVAALLHFNHKKTIAMYLMVVDKKYNNKVSFGNLLVGKSIIKAIEADFDVYDFLKGDERYKFHWATAGNCGLQMNFWKKKPGSLLSVCSRMSRYAGKILLR